MKHIILTSSPTGPLDNSYYVDGLDSKNGFKDLMRSLLKDNDRGLIIAAYPDRYKENDEMCDYFRNAFQSVGIRFSTFDLCDSRYPFTSEMILSYDFICLAGGHTPTENKYFEDIELREKLVDFNGVILGMSAGSMNLADKVYFQPEEIGESSSDFKRDGMGLGLCNINIVPHFQMIKSINLDGYSLVYDLIKNDSYGRDLIAINDGTYIYGKDNNFLLFGEAYLIKDGNFTKISEDNQVIKL